MYWLTKSRLSVNARQWQKTGRVCAEAVAGLNSVSFFFRPFALSSLSGVEMRVKRVWGSTSEYHPRLESGARVSRRRFCSRLHRPKAHQKHPVSRRQSSARTSFSHSFVHSTAFLVNLAELK